jgi:hypothetical protein
VTDPDYLAKQILDLTVNHERAVMELIAKLTEDTRRQTAENLQALAALLAGKGVGNAPAGGKSPVPALG